MKYLIMILLMVISCNDSDNERAGPFSISKVEEQDERIKITVTPSKGAISLRAWLSSEKNCSDGTFTSKTVEGKETVTLPTNHLSAENVFVCAKTFSKKYTTDDSCGIREVVDEGSSRNADNNGQLVKRDHFEVLPLKGEISLPPGNLPTLLKGTFVQVGELIVSSLHPAVYSQKLDQWIKPENGHMLQNDKEGNIYILSIDKDSEKKTVLRISQNLQSESLFTWDAAEERKVVGFGVGDDHFYLVEADERRIYVRKHKDGIEETLQVFDHSVVAKSLYKTDYILRVKEFNNQAHIWSILNEKFIKLADAENDSPIEDLIENNLSSDPLRPLPLFPLSLEVDLILSKLNYGYTGAYGAKKFCSRLETRKGLERYIESYFSYQHPKGIEPLLLSDKENKPMIVADNHIKIIANKKPVFYTAGKGYLGIYNILGSEKFMIRSGKKLFLTDLKR